MIDQKRKILENLAKKHGFDEIGVVSVPERQGLNEKDRIIRLKNWLSSNYHGEMEWMANEPEKRASPKLLVPEVRSIIMLGVNYYGDYDYFKALQNKTKANITLYALRRDYHDVIKNRLKALSSDMVTEFGNGGKVFVDTAPVMEKPLAMEAGLGWQGKHSVLVSRKFGNWLLLGAIYTNLEFEPDIEEKNHCGTCRKCLDICPTNAFPAPYILDSNRCIAYLTIEHKGVIPRDLRPLFGNRVFGCDDCLAICPWNKFAKKSHDENLEIKEEWKNLDLLDLLKLNDQNFRKFFAKSPIKRTKRERFLRNVLIAIGNSRNKSLVSEIENSLNDLSPLIRGMAIWALSQLLDMEEFLHKKNIYIKEEQSIEVLNEWNEAEAEYKTSIS